MSKFWDAISLGGFFLTAIGTVISCQQAHAAKKAAKDAKKYRDEVRVDRLKLALVDLISMARHSREECKKIITPVRKPVRGVDSRKVIDTLQNFLDKARENSHKIGMQTFSDLLKDFDGIISEYKREECVDQKYQIADNMYDIISKIISLIVEKLDEKI